MGFSRTEIAKLTDEKLNNKYKPSLSDAIGYIDFISQRNKSKISFSLRLQYDNRLSFQAFSINLKNLESLFSSLLPNELQKFYGNIISLNKINFYKTEFDFNLVEIENHNHLNEYLEEVVKCIEFHEKEIFPKLLDIDFLAEYVGSVPFERKAEVAVGGSFPVHLFKKMAILKWGNQNERYLEYKRGTEILIDKYAIKKPDKYMPEFKKGFDQLVNHLENEPNPFDNVTFANNV